MNNNGSSQNESVDQGFVWKKRQRRSPAAATTDSADASAASAASRFSNTDAQLREIQERRRKQDELRQERDKWINWVKTESTRIEEQRMTAAGGNRNNLIGGSGAGIDDDNAFILRQDQIRARQRVLGGRAQPIDILATMVWLSCNDVSMINVEDSTAASSSSSSSRMVSNSRVEYEAAEGFAWTFSIELKPADEYINELGTFEIQRLVSDAAEYKERIANESVVRYWTAVLNLCQRKSDIRQSTKESKYAALVANYTKDDQLELVEKEVQSRIERMDDIDAKIWNEALSAIQHRRDVLFVQSIFNKARERRLKLQLSQQKVASQRLNQSPQSNDAEQLNTTVAPTESLSVINRQNRMERDRIAAMEDEWLYNQQLVKLGNYEATLNHDVALSNHRQPTAVSGLRKPLYFNRVQTGFNWNQYNKVHYSRDNPPPKQVQGYEFNIFYPDLRNSRIEPTCRTMPDPQSSLGENQTELIVFSAGAPYQDIGFRILKGQWAQRSKPVFNNGQLTLRFRFKRSTYRR